jgi:DNA invertase Pin-like site-specific DNA recombinase
MIQESILKELQRNGFELISTLEPDLCSTDPTRVLIRQILGAFAEYEAKMIVLKLRGARQRAAAKNPNYKEGRRICGHHAGEAETVQRIVTLRDSGHNLSQIAAQLMVENRPTRDGGVWRGSQISRILRTAS